MVRGTVMSLVGGRFRKLGRGNITRSGEKGTRV